MGTNRFSGLYRFRGLFGGDGPSLLNRYITVVQVPMTLYAYINSNPLNIVLTLSQHQFLNLNAWLSEPITILKIC